MVILTELNYISYEKHLIHTQFWNNYDAYTGRNEVSKIVHRLHFRKSSAPVQRFGVHPVYMFYTQSEAIVVWCAPIKHCGTIASLETKWF